MQIFLDSGESGPEVEERLEILDVVANYEQLW